MRHLLISIFVTALFFTTWFAGTRPGALTYIDRVFYGIEKTFIDAGNFVANAILHKAITVTELKQKYNAPLPTKVRVLIIPGHEPYYGGTEFGNLKEREMNVELSTYLGEFLRNNGRYDVMLARDNNTWSPTLHNYFIADWENIIAFFQQSKEQNLQNIATATTTKQPKATVQHNKARTDVAMRLYGINKWGNENGIDIALHVHFNDYPRRSVRDPGVYSGFAVYVPEEDFTNSPTTQAVAKAIYNRIAKYNPVSNLPIEDGGIVESPDLIAIGAHNTSNAASMLIEYGYIYETQFQDPVVRSKTLKDLAFQTYLGLQDFFGSGNDVSFAYDTLMLPYEWDENVTTRSSNSEDVLALQSALLLDGLYPSGGRSKNDCPRSGKLGPCTLGAVQAFQKRYGIIGEEGYVGEKTRAILNGKYSVRAI